jgi:2-dehydropantoate 2-reductase
MPPSFEPRSVAVIGAGAVGTYYGAVLARTGVEVMLIGRTAQVEAIRRDGLIVVEADGEWRAEARASTDVASAAGADVVLVAVKTPDTTPAARSLAAHLAPRTRIVSLQNGVDNAERIAAVLPNPVCAAVVYVGAYMEGPGRVRHTGRGELVIGVPRALGREAAPEADVRAIAAMFERAGIACPVSPDIEADLWTKLTINCAYNAISALGRARYGRMIVDADVRAVMEAAVRETVAVARASGIDVAADALLQVTWKVGESMTGQFSSTAQDIERGKPTEIDALNGLVARRGAELGLATPVNRTLHALVKLRESGTL